MQTILRTLTALAVALSSTLAAQDEPPAVVEAASLQGKVLCGYQGWFRCPGDPANLGWIHWSRNSTRIAPELLTFEMWPDMSEYSASECYPVPGFTYPNGRPAELFSSDDVATVLRHFQWMRDYGIDGAWLQQFLVDLPGGTQPDRYPSRLRVLRHVQAAARQTGRVWALAYDIADLPLARIFDTLTNDWRKLADEGTFDDPRYLHQNGRPVVLIWGFYYQNAHNLMTAELANKLIGFFKKPGRYSAFLIGGGDWNWRHNLDPDWQAFLLRFDGYAPWNVGNYGKDAAGQAHASMTWWAEDKRVCEARGQLWLPVVYPGFSWDNVRRLKPGASTIPRRGGRFLWEQFHELSKLGVDHVYVAMFDEVDEGTAVFKVTSAPPVQGHFVGYEGLPSDWYLRLVGEGERMLRGQRPVNPAIPISIGPSTHSGLTR